LRFLVRNVFVKANVRHTVLALTLIAAVLQAPFFAFAQDAIAPEANAPTAAAPATVSAASDVLIEQQKLLDDMAARVDEIEKHIAANTENDAALVDDRLALEAMLDETLASGVAFRPRLGEINSRLEQLGPAPPAEQPAESELVTKERQALTAEKAEINVLLGRAEDLSVRVNNLIAKISNLRRDLFTGQLTKRSELSDAIGRKVLEDLATEGRVLRTRVTNSLRFAFRNKLQPLITATFLSLLAALLVLVVGRMLFGRLLYRDASIEDPNYISRLSVAFWSSLLPSLVLAICFLTASSLFASMGIFTGGVTVFFGGVLMVIFLGYLVNRISRAVLSPDMPNWRLISIEPGPARTLVWLITALGVIVGADSVAGSVSSWLGSPLSVTIVKSLFAAIVSGVLIIAISRVKPFLAKDGSARAWPSWFRLILLFIGVGSIIAAVTGYISLAQFVSSQIVVTGAVLTMAYIGLAASSAISEEGGLTDTAFGRWLKTENGFDDARLDQLGVLASVVINILIVVLFLPFVLFQWGFQPGDIATWVNRAAGGFKVGAFSFSPFAILTGLGVFLIGYFVTRWFQRWLDGTVMARGRVDPGVRNSIRTVVGYAGLAIALLIAVSAAGFNLSNIAIIAGGLSLGIGFGLQNIVSNFVSGLILLAERPFKVGDWIETGATSGIVKKISVRATEIETFQRQTVIMPNSTFINGAVMNWTHRNKLGRIEVPFGVVYASDPKQVHDSALAIVRAHPMVLRNPEPAVLFQGFTDIAMSFEARAFLADISNGGTVRNDLRTSLVEGFRVQGIILATTLNPQPAAQQPGGVGQAKSKK
jgi:potassium efflux system protein